MDQSKLEAQSLINLGKSLAIDNCTKIESTRELVNPEEQKQIVVNCDNGTVCCGKFSYRVIKQN